MADENGGRLKNRGGFFADELGTCPPIQSLELMFSASRSRGLMLVPISCRASRAASEELWQGKARRSLWTTARSDLPADSPQPARRRWSCLKPWEPHGDERLHHQRKERPIPEPADDRAAPHDAGRAEVHAKGQLYCGQDRRPPHAGAASPVPGLGHPSSTSPTRYPSAPSGRWPTPASRNWRQRSSASTTRLLLRMERSPGGAASIRRRGSSRAGG